MAELPRRSRVLSSIARLATGTAIAQALPLLVTPVIARLYSPAQFGRFGVFSATLLGLSLFVSGRYEIAVPVPGDEDDAFHLLGLSIVVTAASVLLMLVAGSMLTPLRHTVPAISWLTPSVLAILTAGVAGAALTQSCSYWMTRNGNFSAVARSRVTQGTIAAGLSVALAWTPAAPWGLMLSQAIGMGASALLLSIGVLKRDGHRLRTLSSAKLRSVAREYREFPLINTPHAVVDTIKDSGSLLLFTSLFGAAAAGLLTQALRLLRAPSTLIGQAVGQVFFPEASARVASGESIQRMTKRALRGVLAISIPLYALVVAAGPWLFSWVLGAEWKVSGVYAQVLSPWLALALALSSLSLLPVIMRKQPQALALNVLDTVLRLSGIAIGARLGGPIGAITGMAATGLLIGGVQLFWYLRLSRDRKE